MATTWLDKLEQELNIDVDWMDPDFLVQMQPTIKFHDLTSNQNFVDIQMGHPSNVELLRETAREVRDEYASSPNQTHPLWLAVYTRMAVRMCKKVVDLIQGRVLLQTSPAQAYDTQATLAHARLYDAEFARAGIPRNRFCIKIPSTGAGLVAASALQAQGIQTLGTALFGIPQARAASQAGCLSISPYYNDVRVHADRTTWPAVADPATQHPTSPRLIQILELYRRQYAATGTPQPLVKAASFVSKEEALAAGELGCHSATLFNTLIEELAGLPYTDAGRPGGAAAAKDARPKPQGNNPATFYKDRPAPPARLQAFLTTDPLNALDASKTTVDYETASTTDYLADGGKVLDAAIAADKVTKEWLDAALTLFIECEKRSQDKVEAVLASL